MIWLIIIGLVVLVVGKLRLTRAIVLTAVPFALIVGGLIAALTPDAILVHPLWKRVINYTVLIGYMVLLALPFRNSKGQAPAEAIKVPAQKAAGPNAQ